MTAIGTVSYFSWYVDSSVLDLEEPWLILIAGKVRMAFLPPLFKAVSLIFACAAVITGVHAMVDPLGFSRSFGIPINTVDNAGKFEANAINALDANSTISYVSLMGVRQLATGVTLLVFAYQGKWTEMATILAILGILVAGTDGLYLFHSGARSQARFHAIPGALIALLFWYSCPHGCMSYGAIPVETVQRMRKWCPSFIGSTIVRSFNSC